ncbi:MAG: hypothetical protein S4CHLAM20_02270 [Chlamydiia bacterium]|nr:hypothetical protein [Chlamydiia bacterium]
MYKYLFCLMISVSIFNFSETKQEIRKEPTCAHCGKGLSSAFVDVVKKSGPAVVYIETKYSSDKKVASEADNQSDPFRQFQDELFDKFFGRSQVPNRREKPPATGSGFIVSDDGYIVTNYHVIEGAAEILVEIYENDGEKEYKAELIGCDPKTDIAVIKIEEKNLPYLKFADSDLIEQGQCIVAIGHPLRLRDSVTTGVISAKHRMNLANNQIEDYIQTDASLNPGSSGGPLLDLNGEVIAVNTAIIPPSHRNMGVGFSVPSNIAKMIYEHVKETGTVNRGFLGVSIQDLTEDLIEGFGYKKGTKGALVASVSKDSVAERVGLIPGDLIISFNEKSIKNAKNFSTEVGKLPAGKKCKVKILRKGKTKTLSLELGSQMPEASTKGDIIHRLGVIVEDIPESDGQKYNLKKGESGVVIKEIVSGSLAHRSGWKAGSVIMVINGTKITKVEDLSKALEKAGKGKKLVALLSLKGQALFTSITTP